MRKSNKLVQKKSQKCKFKSKKDTKIYLSNKKSQTSVKNVYLDDKKSQHSEKVSQTCKFR